MERGSRQRQLRLYDTTTLSVIGVVEDFYLSGVWQKVEPAMLRLSASDQYHFIAVRANTEDLPGILGFYQPEMESNGHKPDFWRKDP